MQNGPFHLRSLLMTLSILVGKYYFLCTFRGCSCIYIPGTNMWLVSVIMHSKTAQEKPWEENTDLRSQFIRALAPAERTQPSLVPAQRILKEVTSSIQTKLQEPVWDPQVAKSRAQAVHRRKTRQKRRKHPQRKHFQLPCWINTPAWDARCRSWISSTVSKSPEAKSCQTLPTCWVFIAESGLETLPLGMK